MSQVTINDMLNGAKLSNAAYGAGFQAGMGKTENDKAYLDALTAKNWLGDPNMSLDAAKVFASQYSVFKTFTDPDSGLSATVFEDKAGHRTLAIAGTKNPWDVIVDLLTIAPGIIPTQSLVLQQFFDEQVKPYLKPGEQVSVDGHSLAGFMGQIFTSNNPTYVDHALTYNAPGIGGVGAELLAAWGLAPAQIDNPLITNVIAKDGVSIVSHLGTMLGNIVLIPGSSHSIVDDVSTLTGMVSMGIDGLAPDTTNNFSYDINGNSWSRQEYDTSGNLLNMTAVTNGQRVDTYFTNGSNGNITSAMQYENNQLILTTTKNSDGNFITSIIQGTTNWLNNGFKLFYDATGIALFGNTGSGYVNPELPPLTDPNLNLSTEPIGAFYEVTSPANDNAPSIANLTGQITLNGTPITKDQLAALDTNHDGTISAADSAYSQLAIWRDLNENGTKDSGEVTALAQTIRSEDYTQYTAGNATDRTTVIAQPTQQTVNSTAPGRITTPITPAPPAQLGVNSTEPGRIATPSAPTQDTAQTINADWYINNTNVSPYFIVNGNQVSFSDGTKVGINGTTAIGTNGNDSFDAYSFSPYFNSSAITTYIAGAGDDVMGGNSGADSLFGGTGDDTLYGYEGNDSLYGEDGNDAILGGAGDDVAFGGAGADEIQGNAGNDRLYGDAGDDTLFGQVGNDTIFGGDGNDILIGFNASGESQTLAPGETDNDVLYGEAGDDTIVAGLGDDIAFGGIGNDYISGGDGNDKLYGEDGDFRGLVLGFADNFLEVERRAA